MGKTTVVVACAAAVAVGLGAAVVVRRRTKRDGNWGKAMGMLKELEEKCATPVAKLKQVADAMTVEMHAGLASQGGSKLQMIISFVDSLPTGYFVFFFTNFCDSFKFL